MRAGRRAASLGASEEADRAFVQAAELIDDSAESSGAARGGRRCRVRRWPLTRTHGSGSSTSITLLRGGRTVASGRRGVAGQLGWSMWMSRRPRRRRRADRAGPQGARRRGAGCRSRRVDRDLCAVALLRRRRRDSGTSASSVRSRSPSHSCCRTCSSMPSTRSTSCVGARRRERGGAGADRASDRDRADARADACVHRGRSTTSRISMRPTTSSDRRSRSTNRRSSSAAVAATGPRSRCRSAISRSATR